MALMIACCIVAFVIEAQGSLTLGGLQIAAAEVAEYQADHPLTVLVGFLALYIAATAIPFAGAIFLTLASGALFGEVVGTMLVSVYHARRVAKTRRPPRLPFESPSIEHDKNHLTPVRSITLARITQQGATS